MTTNTTYMDEIRKDINSSGLIRVLLLDDEPANLLLRTAILRKNGYECIPSSTVEEAMTLLDKIDVAVLDYHLGHGKFGTEIADELRRTRSEVPIIILSASLEHRFGGTEDMHLLKGYSSVDDLLTALNSLSAKKRGKPVVVDARDFFYSRISMAMGNDILLQILDADGTWQYVNDAAAEYLAHPREWFPGRNMFVEMPTLLRDWRSVIATVSANKETYIDRTPRGLLSIPRPDERPGMWSILAFPMTLHNGESGVVLSARLLERSFGGPIAIA